MKKYFPLFILISIVLIGGISSCKKKEIVNLSIDYALIVKGNYLGIFYTGWSSLGGSSSHDTIINYTGVLSRFNNTSIIFENDTMRYCDSLSNSTQIYFDDKYLNSSAAYEYSYLKLNTQNDSIYYWYTKAYLSGGEGKSFKGIKQ